MKKRLLLLPVLIISVLLSSFTFTAYADDEPDYDAAFQNLVENDEWQNGTYLLFRLPNREINSNFEYYFFSVNDLGCHCNYSAGIISMTSVSEAKAIFLGYVNSYSLSNDNVYIEQKWTASSLTYNESTKQLKLPGYRYNRFFDTWEDLICLDVEILGAIVNGNYIYGTPPDGLNVSVEFSPEFSGDVDRCIRISNGNMSYLNDFNFTVTNNGNTGIQYAMAIVEKGASLNFDDSNFSDKGANRIIYDSNVIYLYISQEDCYVNIDAGTFTTATMNSSLHYVASKGQTRNIVKWDMVDLKENHEYDAVVYAVENKADKTSFVDMASTTYKFYVADYVDYGDVSEVYRSTFKLFNPATYDSSSSYNGAVANNSFTDYDDLTRTMFSYTDYTDDGEKKLYGNFKYGQDVYNTSGELSWIDDYGDYSKGSTSYTSLVSEGSGVLRFFSSVLSYFPSVFLRTFVVGFWSLIVIAIIKKVT